MPGRRSFFALEGDPGILQTTPLHKIVDIFEMIVKSHAAQAVEEGAKAAGADVEIMEVADADVDKALSFDVLALGCPAMGDEELEDGEFEPFFSDLEGKLSGKKVALFGSYDWGDGEWMRTWCGRAKDAGAELVEDEGLICNNTPDDEGLAACRELGGKLA